MRGTYIAFEGGEGSGKSTQAARLAERLGAALTREPGGTELGSRIRDLLLDRDTVDLEDRAEALLVAADRAQLLPEVVLPALEQGRHVVSDRSSYSTLAYQGHGRGLPLDELRRICDWACLGRWPDLVVLVDVPVELGRGRMTGDHDRMEQAGLAFHERVREGYQALAAAEPHRWVVVDGTPPVDVVEAAVLAAVQDRIG